MKSFESLDEELKELLLLNGGDINILAFPYLIKDAKELGISEVELTRRVRKVYDTIDLTPFHRIDELLQPILLKESLFEAEAEWIIKDLQDTLQRTKTINYILSVIRKKDFKTRERKSPEADSFKNLWMTDEAWVKYEKETLTVEWLGEKASSLYELGEFSLQKKEDAKYYFRNTASLGSLVLILTKSASQADEYSKIIESEPDTEKRFLKIIYRLNPILPFKINNQSFADIGELLHKTATDYALFVAAIHNYEKGYIHIWLKETDLLNAPKLTTGYDLNSFLTFIFKVNAHHGIYLNEEKFENPEVLITKIKQDISYWHITNDNMLNGILPTWFNGIGKQEWVEKYNIKFEGFKDSNFYTKDENTYESVQTLLQIVDNSVVEPELAVSPTSIKLLALEGSKPVTEKVQISLQNFGFAKAYIMLDHDVDGIHLNKDHATFFSLSNNITAELLLEIAPLKLVKNKVLFININVLVGYRTISIPVEIKVVFPQKAFVLQLFKYAMLGAIFFGAIRYLLSVSVGNNNENSTINNYLQVFGINKFSSDYHMYFFVMILFFAGLVSSCLLIKKAEKI